MPEEDLYREALGRALRKLEAKDRFEAEIRGFLADFPAQSSNVSLRSLKNVES